MMKNNLWNAPNLVKIMHPSKVTKEPYKESITPPVLKEYHSRNVMTDY
jgi:hypothetical protein